MFSARHNQLTSTATNEATAVNTRRIWHLYWHCPKAPAHHLRESAGGRLGKGIWTCTLCMCRKSEATGHVAATCHSFLCFNLWEKKLSACAQVKVLQTGSTVQSPLLMAEWEVCWKWVSIFPWQSSLSNIFLPPEASSVVALLDCPGAG